MTMAARLRRALTAVVGTAREVRDAEQRCREAVLQTDEMKRQFKQNVEALERALGDAEGERHGRLGTHRR